MSKKYNTEERRSMILKALHENHKVLIPDLVETFGVSDVSIRKDLAILEERQLLVRVKGGAIIMQKTEEFDDIPILHKRQLHAREKQLLGKFTASLIKEGDTIIIDSGTTMMEIARNLDSFRHLTIITNAMDIAIVLNKYERFDVIVLGGQMRTVSYSTVGMLAESALKKFYCDKLFLGVDSASIKDGLSTPNIEEANLNQAMIAAAKETIAVFDSSKFGRRSFAHIAALDKIGTIVTDSNIPDEFKDYILSVGIKLHIVEI